MALTLTKKKPNDEIYVRFEQIESEIDEALAQDQATIIRRSRLTEKSLPEYLTSECLVHLIRDSIRCDESAIYNALLPILLGRCEVILRRKIPESVPDFENLRQQVLDAFVLVIARDSSTESKAELDYYEVTFNRAFRTLRIDVLRKYTVRFINTVPLSEVSNGDDEDPVQWDDKALQTPASHADRMMFAEFLDDLPEAERQAVVLHYVIGHKIESIDEAETTVATLCNVSGRTIGKLLKNAKERITQLKLEDR